MSKKLYEEDNIQEIASSIREKNEVATGSPSSETYRVMDMAPAIRKLPVINPSDYRTAAEQDVIDNALTQSVDDLKSAFDDVKNLDDIGTISYFSMAKGIAHSNAWGSAASSNNTAYITEQQHLTSVGIDYYFDDAVYKVIGSLYYSSGKFYQFYGASSNWITQSPFHMAFTAQQIASGIFATVEVRRQDNADLTTEEMETMLWTESAAGYPLKTRVLALESAVLALNGTVENAGKTTGSLAGVQWFPGYYKSSDNTYVRPSETPWRMSTAVPCFPGDVCTYCGLSSQTNRWVVVFFDDNTNFLSGLSNLGNDYTAVQFTIPTGAAFMRVLGYADRLSDIYLIYGNTAWQNPLNHIRRTGITVEARITAAEDEIDALEDANSLTSTAYVAVDAAAGGDGSITDPFATLDAAVTAGYRTIKMSAGVYDISQVRIEDGDFDLSLWSNLRAFDTTKPDREKIVFFHGDIIAPTVSGTELTAAYTPRSGRRFERVFVTKDLAPIDSSFAYATAYNVNVFCWKYGHKARRYEPALVEDYTGAAGTFTYDNGSIRLSPFASDAGVDGLKIYVSDDPAVPLYFGETGRVRVSDVVVLGAYYGGLQLYGCQDVTIIDCDFVCTGHGDGFEATDSNVTLADCVASGCAQDGYGFQHYGDSLMENCDGWYCGDDGVSHHRGCTGYIDGGNFSYNSSGGITPAFGAKVDISNAMAVGNENGLQFFGSSGLPSRDICVVSCVAKNNTNKDIYNSGYDIVFVNCVYDTQEATTGHTNTFYG